MFEYFQKVWKIVDLRKKILFVIFAILIYRFAGQVPVPGINTAALGVIFDSNSMLGVFSALTGGNMQHFSIIMMGLAPYINASIIMQLMTVVIPSLEKVNKDEGEEGRKKINSYTRWLTLPLALMQSYGMIALMNMSAQAKGLTLIDMHDPMIILPVMLIVAAGTVFLMWLGEIMTEKGIGNGTSLIIFAGIVSGMPPIIGNIIQVSSFDNSKILPFVLFIVITIISLVAIVVFSEAQRNINITYAVAGNKASKGILPIRLNQAGMIPIIFAIAIITFPSVIAQFLQNSNTPFVADIAKWLIAHVNSSNPTWFYITFYFLLVLGFTYFYVSVTFKPDQVAENIQKRGGFITGIRPGSQTAEYIDKVSFNLNFWGGSFLAFVAVLPIIFTKYTDLSQSDLLISGSGMIIVVGVVLELLRQINAQLVMHDYDKLK